MFVVEKRLVEVFEEWWRWMSGGDWKSQSLLVDGGEESGSRDIIRINQMLKGVFVSLIGSFFSVCLFVGSD